MLAEYFHCASINLGTNNIKLVLLEVAWQGTMLLLPSRELQNERTTNVVVLCQAAILSLAVHHLVLV